MFASRFLRFVPIRRVGISVGELGSGEGKCGGSGGTIREAGGAFGKLEAAREEKYFFELNEEQIRTLKHEVEEHEHPTIVNRKNLSEEEKLSLEAERQRRMIEVPE
uniref:ATPase inhibitor, mitochondrial n=1 Tax=Ascaris lumbricoides TaxID=6252 RepID=A0A0M3IB17_ASCLU